MRPRTSGAGRAMVAAALLTLACQSKPPPDAVAVAVGPASSPAPSTPPAASALEASITTKAGQPRGELDARVVALFEKYKDRTDFGFLRDACSSPVEQFIGLKNVKIDKVIEGARSFFKDKRGLEYVPDAHSIAVTRDGDRTTARFPLTMRWATLPDPEWDHLSFDQDDAGWPIALSDPLWTGLVAHEVTVDVELTYGTDGKLVRYVEGKVHKKMFRVTGDTNCDDRGGDKPHEVLPTGTVVVDLGDRYIPSATPRGPQILRLVRVNGADTWTYEHRSWVGECNGGPCAAFAECLVPTER